MLRATYLPPDNCKTRKGGSVVDFSKGYVYFIQAESNRLIKIGFSGDYPDKRLASHRVSSPSRLIRLGYLKAAPVVERQVHKVFSAFRSHGEWFYPVAPVVNFIKWNATPWTTEENIPRPEPKGISDLSEITHVWIEKPFEHGEHDFRLLKSAVYEEPTELSQDIRCPVCGSDVDVGNFGIMCRAWRCPYGRSEDASLYLAYMVGDLLELCDAGGLASRGNHHEAAAMIRGIRYAMQAMIGKTKDWSRPSRVMTKKQQSPTGGGER